MNPGKYFYPRPPRGGRRSPIALVLVAYSDFYPRPPRGGRLGRCSVAGCGRAISIHALREEGDRLKRDRCGTSPISIHALREEGDGAKFSLENTALFISIHALREEGDSAFLGRSPRANRFLSTPSARRATKSQDHGCQYFGDFYPRPPRGGRRQRRPAPETFDDISIHALREEGDYQAFGQFEADILFLSTPSARRATLAIPSPQPFLPFLSTPSARRATLPSKGAAEDPADFYPRPPRGGRRRQLFRLS